jgi:hypothetical protein
LPRSNRLSFGALNSFEKEKTEECFDIFYKTYKKAEEAANGPVERYFKISGYTVCLRFAGPALEPLIAPAFRHLIAQPVARPDLTVYLFDSASTKTEMPAAPWTKDDSNDRGEIRGYNGRHIKMSFNRVFTAINLINIPLNIAVYWVQDFRQVPYFETSCPMLAILFWWMREHGRQMAHAAAVAVDDKGALLVGRGAAGKTSTALFCLQSGMRFAGEDHVLLNSDPSPFIHSLFCTAKLKNAHLVNFPQLAPLITNSGRKEIDKALIFLNERFGSNISTGFPLRAILIPRITNSTETIVKEVSGGEGLLAWAPATIFQLPYADSDDFKSLVSFVKQVPNYILELGTDFPRIPQVIKNLLSDLK